MTQSPVGVAAVDTAQLRKLVSDKYRDVALNPEMGFHFHNGRPLTQMLGYPADVIDTLPAPTVDSFAGTGNPFIFGDLAPGETVVDIGCGAGLDSLIAAGHVGETGRVIAVDMTPEMRERTDSGARTMGYSNVDVRDGFAETLPVDDGEADVVISNGVVNLSPDKPAVLGEMFRALKPGGRIQVGDILVHLPVPQEAKDDIDLWSG